MENSLFVRELTEEDFEKVATYKLPRNSGAWNQEILRLLYEEYPWLVTDGVQPYIHYHEQDVDNGLAIGAILLTYEPMPDKNERKARAKSKIKTEPMRITIPMVINNFELYPFDVFVDDMGQFRPLSPSRIGALAQPSENFTGLTTPGESEGIGNAFSIPGESAYGRMGNQQISGFERYASARATANHLRDDAVMSQIIPSIRDCHCDEFRHFVRQHPASLASWVKSDKAKYLRALVEANGLSPDDYDNAINNALPMNVFYFNRVSPGQWRLVVFSDLMYAPKTTYHSETELLANFSGFPEVADRVWDSDEFIITSNHESVQPFVMSRDSLPVVSDIKANGRYIVPTKNSEILTGSIFCNICDYLGNDQNLKLFIGDEMSFGMSGNVVGEALSGSASEGIKECAPLEGWATWVDKGADKAYMPFKIRQVYTKDGKCCLHGSDFFGRSITFVLTPGLKKPYTPVNVTSPVLGDHLDANIYHIPADWTFVRLGRRVKLAETVSEFHRDFKNQSIYHIHNRGEQASRPNTVHVRRVGNKPNLQTTASGSIRPMFRLEGEILSPILGTADSGDWGPTAGEWSHKKAKLALVLLGCSLEVAEDILARATDVDPVVVSNLRPVRGRASFLAMPEYKVTDGSPSVLKKQGSSITLDWEETCDKIRTQMFKEAAVLKDDMSIDTLLSLNFITPENLTVYLQNIPRFEDIESRLAELLLLTRVGLKAVPEKAAYNAMKGLSAVVDSLKALSFFIQDQVDPHIPDEAVLTPDQDESEGEQEEEAEATAEA